ncbi:MAG TPA: hypothetical protein VGG16_01820 [Streptosporangiaceae bacterium]
MTRRAANPAPLTQREIDALVLCAEHCGIPYDLLASILGVPVSRAGRIVGRWCDLGWAAAGRLGDGPGWCWLLPAGMRLIDSPYRSAPPNPALLAHSRAVLAARLRFSASEPSARWRPERDLAGPAHVADGELYWPDGGRFDGQVWAIEVELTPKSLGRTVQIIHDLLRNPAGYAAVVYLVSPAARSVVFRAVDALPRDQRARVSVRAAPAEAFIVLS